MTLSSPRLSSEERDELARSTAQFLDAVSGHDQIRALVDAPLNGETTDAVSNGSAPTDQGFDNGVWKEIVDLGWTGIHVPEQLGGAGGSYDALAVILHEMGRHLTIAPFISSSVIATEAFLRSSNRRLADGLLPRLAAGDVRATATVGSNEVLWRPAGGGAELDGCARFVLDAAGADVIVLVAHSQTDGPIVVAVDGDSDAVTCTHVPTMDRTRRLADVRIDGLAVPTERLLARPGDESQALADRISAVGAIAVAADGAAAAEKVTELTVEYVKNRVQFGRPVGSFQAVKHHCANMIIAVEASNAAVRAAFDVLDGKSILPGGDQSTDDVGLAAHVASSYAGPACSRVCALAIQVHGGIGFTWEHDAHLYLKRAKLDEMLFGSPSWHRRRLAAKVFPGISPGWGEAAL